MVGLSVVLEAQKSDISKKNKETPKVINKTMMLNSINKQSSSSSSYHHSHFEEQSTFLELCFLCRKRLLPGKDIYMYKGDRAFCSVECRCKQIFMDEEESSVQNENCYFAAISSSSSTSEASYHQKGRRNKGGFAY